MTLASGIEIPTDQIRQICRRYHVREMAIFGSAARGGMHPGCDIDVPVELDPDANLGWEFFDLEQELTQAFGRKVDLGTKRSLKPWIRVEALKDAQIVYAA